MSLILGQKAENTALDFLRQQGLGLVERNYRCRGGEIDLIMQVDGVLVFIEVRQRSSVRFGSALESVDSRKRARLLHSAQHYLRHHPESCRGPCRFDVVAIEGEAGKIRWIQNAFGED